MFTFRRIQLNVLSLYNENTENRNMTYWRLIRFYSIFPSNDYIL